MISLEENKKYVFAIMLLPFVSWNRCEAIQAVLYRQIAFAKAHVLVAEGTQSHLWQPFFSLTSMNAGNFPQSVETFADARDEGTISARGCVPA
jgi:hypothetical protein